MSMLHNSLRAFLLVSVFFLVNFLTAEAITPAFPGAEGGGMFTTGMAPTDTDIDGMPDSWETANGIGHF